MLSLAEARARILELAEPTHPIEVPLSEAMGLVVAEPLLADVDLPPFDRAAHDGYAVRAADARVGARLRVIGGTRPAGGRAVIRARSSAALAAVTAAELAVNPGEAAHLRAGAPIPVGADAVLRNESSRPEPGNGPPRVVEVLQPVDPGQSVVKRGTYLKAGTPLVERGTRLHPALAGLLAAQGCVHPVCHRRVRVAVLAAGDQLVGPNEAPVMNRERNAAGSAVVIPCIQWGATAHDLGTVTLRELPAALDRALTAPVVVVIGELEGAIPRALKRAGVRPTFEGITLHPGKRTSHGVVGPARGPAEHHVFHMAPGPVGVATAVALLLAPLIARLHGGSDVPAAPLRAVWHGPAHRPTDDRLWAVPVHLQQGDDAQLQAVPISHLGKDDLLGFSRADALALLPARSGPWVGGEFVEVVPLGPWPRAGARG